MNVRVPIKIMPEYVNPEFVWKVMIWLVLGLPVCPFQAGKGRQEGPHEPMLMFEMLHEAAVMPGVGLGEVLTMASTSSTLLSRTV